jgi:hypothetical protein
MSSSRAASLRLPFAAGSAGLERRPTPQAPLAVWLTVTRLHEYLRFSAGVGVCRRALVTVLVTNARLT